MPPPFSLRLTVEELALTVTTGALPVTPETERSLKACRAAVALILSAGLEAEALPAGLT